MPLRPPAGFISAFFDPLNNPNAPTIGTATGGDASASVTFTAPSNTGGAAITQYYAVSNPSQITGNAASSPVAVSGLTNGTSYTFTVWALNSFGPSPYSAASGSVTPAGIFGLFGGGSTGTNTNVIQYISIGTTGNATDFGDLTVARTLLAAAASSTRAVFGGGLTGSAQNVIDYVTIASAGNATAFGDLTVRQWAIASCSSSTRGIWAGGYDQNTIALNVIDYVTIATTGNALDFGDLLTTVTSFSGCSSPTRGVFSGGDYTNVIQYITMASTGNALDFGDLLDAVIQTGSCSSSTRGLVAYGQDSSGISSGDSNIIVYITIASTGNATDFGDLTLKRTTPAGCSSSTRGVFGGGYQNNSSTYTNVIDYVTIASVGNASDFGDLLAATTAMSACSNGHGGL